MTTTSHSRTETDASTGTGTGTHTHRHAHTTPLHRLLAIGPVLVVLSLLAFCLQALTPGDPARLLVEASGVVPAPPELVVAKRDELGLDRPLAVRYLAWLGNALQGDFGHSYRSYEPVSTLYLQRLPATALLALSATLVSLLVALPLGMLAAYQRGGWLDRSIRAVAVAGAAAPGFWVALVLMYVFGARLQWLPVFGSLSLRGIILPTVVVSLPLIAMLTRLVRAATLEVRSSDFLLVARGKGLHPLTLVRRHLLPNVLVSIIPVAGLEVAGLLTGAAVVEYLFAWPGVGRLAIEAVLLRDTPVVVGFTVAAGLIVVLTTLVADLLVARLDPRLRNV